MPTTNTYECPTCGCGGVTCDGCPDGAATQYTVTVAGFSDGTCSDCANLNAAHVLDYDSACTWTKQISPGADCGGDSTFIELTMVESSGSYLTNVEIYTGSSGARSSIAIWNGSDTVPRCLQLQVLALASSSAKCGTVPLSVDVDPV